MAKRRAVSSTKVAGDAADAPDASDAPASVLRPKRGRKKRTKPAAKDITGRGYLKTLQSLLQELRTLYPHPNRVLHYDDVVVAHLLAFFNPMINSLRMIEDMSEVPAIAEQFHVDSVCRSTLSDAHALFDPDYLMPLIEQLRPRLPQLKHQDRELAVLLDRVIAFDGSFFRLAAEVDWAYHLSNKHQTHSFVRLNLAYAARTGTPVGCSIDGGPTEDDDGTRVKARHEGAALAEMIEPGQIYLFDAGVVNFDLLKRLFTEKSDFVASLKEQVNFTPQQTREPTDRDREAGVVSDTVGVLAGSQCRVAPTQPVREVRVRRVDRDGRAVELRLLTSLLDLPAHLVAALYQWRWQIELFFRWFKITAGFHKLMSHSRNGIQFSFYIAIIAQMLMCLRTGTPVNRYGLMLMGMVASGQASVEDILPTLHKRHRERMIERQRLAKKKAQASSSQKP